MPTKRSHVSIVSHEIASSPAIKLGGFLSITMLEASRLKAGVKKMFALVPFSCLCTPKWLG